MITLQHAYGATGGRWIASPDAVSLSPDTPLLGGAIDTRALRTPQGGPADIFFALQGERDGHDFLPSLAGTYIKLAVVSKLGEIPGFKGAVLLVPDTLRALADMGRFLVERFRPKVVAITGSYGKTTTKEIVAHVLSATRHILQAPGSLNNEIGTPLTLLALDGSQDTCVLEYSARKPGDITYLSVIAPPDIAVLTAVGHAHVGVFGSVEAIYQTKSEIFGQLQPGGLALVNAEDPRLAKLAAAHAKRRGVSTRIQTFGRAGDFRAELIQSDNTGRQSFMGVHTTAVSGTRMPMLSEVSGPHGLYPMLIAWAVARELGVPDAEVASRAGKHPGQKGRAVSLKGPGGAALLDDTYNASPETVRNLIATLSSFSEPEKILVLGRLAELEDGLEVSTALIGAVLRPPLSDVYVHAPNQPELFASLKKLARGVRMHSVEDQQVLITKLRGRDKPGTVIGFKAGRSSHLERVVEGVMGVRIDCALSPCGLLKHCTDCEAMTRHG